MTQIALTSLALLFSFAHASTTPLKVMIDPGHGGVDTGAVYGEAKEAEITLKVAQHLKAMIDASSEFKSGMTRTQDLAMPLPERVHAAEKENADLFLSIHANASPDKRARGVEFYFQNQLPADEESMFLANLENQVVKDGQSSEGSDRISKKTDVLTIIEDLKRQTKMRSSYVLSNHLFKSWNPNGSRNSNVIRQAPFYVISKTNIPSVLVELGFISNPKESQKLIQPQYQKEVAQKIFKGLQAYKEMVDKGEPGRLQ